MIEILIIINIVVCIVLSFVVDYYRKVHNAYMRISSIGKHHYNKILKKKDRYYIYFVASVVSLLCLVFYEYYMKKFN